MADILVRDTRTGEVYPIPEDAAPELIRRGLVVPSQGEAPSSGLGGAAHRFLESIASETTLGGSDIARRNLGLTGSQLTAAVLPAAIPMLAADVLSGQHTAEEIDAAQQRRAEEHPVADIAGRVAGGLGQAIATGGASTEATAGRILARLSPVGLAEAGGDIAARAIRGTISGRAGRVAGALGRFGTEGAIAGMEGMVTDAAANDTPLTGEALVAGAGMGGILGLGMGALGTGVSAGIRRMRAQRLANGAFGPGPLDRALGRTQEILGGVDRGIINEMQDPARRALATTPEHELLDIASQRASALDDIAQAREYIQRHVIDRGAPGYASHLANVDPHLAQTAALSFLNDGIRSLRAGIQGAGPVETRGLSTLLGRLRRTARRLLPSTTKAGTTRAPRVQSAFDIYREMDVLHTSLGASLERITDPVEKQIVDDIFHSLQGRVDDSSGTRQWVPGLLSEPRVWGEAANIHARYSQTVTELLNLQKSMVGRTMERTSREGEALAARFTTPKMRSALEFLGSQKGEDLRSGILEWLDRQERLATIYRDDLGAGEAADTLLSLIARERVDLAKTIDHFEAYNTLRRGELMEQRSRGFGAAAGIGGASLAGIAGYSITGNPWAALGIATGFAALTRPMQFYRLMATKDRVLGQMFQGRFSSAMGRLRSRLRGLPVRSKAGFVSPLVAPMVIAKSRQERDREFDDRIAEIRQLQTNPQAAIDNIGDSLADMSTFQPRTASYMHEAVQRGLQYLIAHLPLAEQNPLGPQFSQRRPSNTEQDNFLRIFRVVDDPLSAVEDLADLRLHPISARTLRDVYPEIFNLTRQELVYELGELEQDPPYQVKISLGTLLQYPTDPSLDPTFMAMLQARSAQTTEQSRTVGLSQRGAQSGLAERTMTETTSLMNPE